MSGPTASRTAAQALTSIRGLGANETGGVAALPIWIAYMQRALKGVPEQPLTAPEGVVQLRINADSGLRDRLFNAISPRLKNEIESAIRTIRAQARPPGGNPFPDEQVRSARARVMEVAHGALMFDS